VGVQILDFYHKTNISAFFLMIMYPRKVRTGKPVMHISYVNSGCAQIVLGEPLW
jgi:hypothetical protein